MTTLLSVRDLTVTLPSINAEAGAAVQAVRGLAFELEKGATLGIVGESGSGQSMAALALMGPLPAGATAGGSVRSAGEDLLTAGQTRRCAPRGNRMAMTLPEPTTPT